MNEENIGCVQHDCAKCKARLVQPERLWVGLTDAEITAIVDHNGLVEGWVLYTSPPASKPWLGLTEDDKTALWRIGCNQWTMDQVEAKLREKNT